MSQNTEALGMLELSSIAVAYQVQDAMVKAADVELLVARTICSGKYIVMVGGQPSAVASSLEAGKELSREALIDELLIPDVDARIFPAISGAVPLTEKDKQALGILEAFSVTAIVEGADAALKASDVTCFRIHVAMAIGGKAYYSIAGEVGAVEEAVNAGVEYIKEKGLLVHRVVIPNPRPEIIIDRI